jgi:hypothetical protein
MAEIEAFPIERTRRFHFDWLLPVLWRPRRTLNRITEVTNGAWLTPMLVLTLAVLVTVFVAGPIRKEAAMAGTLPVPQDFQWWPPEQQELFMQNLSGTSGPLFTHGIPAFSGLVKIWFGWLLLGGVLHLTLTLAGSRSSAGSVLSVVAWASTPLILRYVVQSVYMLSTHTLIRSPGLAGFAPVGEGGGVRFLTALLPLIDLYLVWQVALMVVGLRPLSRIPLGRIWIAVLISVAIVLAVMALPGFLLSQMEGLNIVRPFYF